MHPNDGKIILQDTLINSWNFLDLEPSTIWHSNEHAQNISAENIHDIDPKGEKIMKSTHGILKVNVEYGFEG